MQDGQNAEYPIIRNCHGLMPFRVLVLAGNQGSEAEDAIPHAPMMRTDIPHLVKRLQPGFKNAIGHTELTGEGDPLAARRRGRVWCISCGTTRSKRENEKPARIEHDPKIGPEAWRVC